MENQKNDNLNMLEAILQNTEMGKNTLDQLVPMANRVSLRRQTTRSAGWSKCFFHWFATKQTS